MISPPAVKMMPEPCSLSLPRSVCSCTTLGTTFAATCSIEVVALTAGSGTAALAVAVVPRVDRYGCTATAATPPMDADITATASPAITNGARREGVCCFRCAGYTRSNSTGACAASRWGSWDGNMTMAPRIASWRADVFNADPANPLQPA